ncbi:MAG: SAM-dependent methyltransferase [Candidatus Micrarchaeota archaeon]
MASKERKFFCKSADGSITYTTDGNFLYADTGKGEVRLDMFSGHYYKLKPYNDVPVLEVDGLRMQLIKDFKSPLDYSKEVVKGLNIPKNGAFTVLDTCMGLGYTAIAASEIPSVHLVVTCEVSEAVLALAQWNPLSEPLFRKGGNILVMKGSTAGLVKGFEAGTYSFVIHDPPRISHAPELYSLEFYRDLCRVCKSGARIFHYVGSVGKGKGRQIDREVAKRLNDAGFSAIHYVPRLQGLYAQKH